VIWFHPLPAHELAADFRTQTYQGKPVLTWWQGPPNLGAVSGGADYIYNDRYQKIAEVKGANGYSADGQEFLITPWNTAVIIADTITTANLTSIDSSSGPLLPYSRVVTVRLDLATKVATLVKSIRQPEGLLATEEGNAQTTHNGDLFVGWGALPYISEFSPAGKLLFNAQLPGDDTSYRAYRLPWRPAS
jgi:hypothetical protein